MKSDARETPSGQHDSSSTSEKKSASSLATSIRARWPIRIAIRLVEIMTFLACLLTLSAFGARWNWYCDLTAHWPVQLAVSMSLACCVLLLAGRWKLALLAGIVSSMNVAYVAPLYFPQQQSSTSGEPFRVVSANVHTSNRDTRRFLEFIHSVEPDLILVMEVDSHWQQALQDLRINYPFSIVRSRSDNFGIAILSRRPFLSGRIELLDDSGIPTIIATVDFEGDRLYVVGTHPLPPVGRKRSELRNRHLDAIGDLVAQLRPVIVLGDLNTTSWSPHFHALLQNGHLHDSRQGFGVQATWPTEPWLLRIPIDHALQSDGLVITNRYVGPDVGSDHFPVVIEFAKAR